MAAWVDGAWMYFVPQAGWSSYIKDEDKAVIFDGESWQISSLENAPTMGINATASIVERLSVQSNAVLFSHDKAETGRGSIRLKLNKANGTDEADIAFDDNWMTRTTIGLGAANSFDVKVNTGNGNFKTPISIAANTGKIALNEATFGHSTVNIQGSALNGTGTGYFCFTVSNTNANKVNKGGAVMTCASYDNTHDPWMVIGPWSTASANIIYYGGGGWGVPDATDHWFYTGPHDPSSSNTATRALQITAQSIAAERPVVPNVDDTFTLGSAAKRWAAIYSATNVITTSDARQKTQIKPCDLGLNFLTALQPVSFEWRDGPTASSKPYNAPTGSRRRHYGLLAQQVKKTLDDIEAGDFGGWTLADVKDSDSAQGLRYEQFIPVLIKAVQELAARLQEIETSQKCYGAR